MLELAQMPDFDFDKMGGLMTDLEGYLKDSNGYYFGRVFDDSVHWSDSRGENARVITKFEDIVSVKRSRELHTYDVALSDGTVMQCLGSLSKPGEYTIPPERKNAPFLDLNAILEYNCPDFAS